MSSETGYSDKTVDFKAINSYKKNVNILNKIGYENSAEFKELNTFLKEYKLDKNDRSVKANVTSPYGRYLIPNTEKASAFFRLLEKCREKKIALHFREMQYSDLENKEGSGIMIDFDIYQDSDKNPLETKNTQSLCKIIMKCLDNMLDRDRDINLECYVGVIVKPRLIFNEEKGLWKNGIHILIPHVQLSKEQKRLFLQKVLQCKDCQYEFKEVFGVSLASALDLMCASVPVYFLHNCKEDSAEPYILKEFYKFRCKKDAYAGADYDISPVAISGSVNKELSMTFSGVDYEKKFYKFKEEYSKQLNISSKREQKFTAEMDESLEVFNHFNSYVDENLEYYKTLVLEVLDIKRAEDRKMWRDTVFAIANINKGFKGAFKEIARLFSMRCPDKYDSESFETIWDQAVCAKNNSSLTFNSIVYWCKEDNSKKFDSILDKDITTIIELDSFSRSNQVLTGSLFQYHFAYYIFHLFKQKFAYDIDGKNGKWYEFVLDSDEHRTGEIYKWRHEVKPDNLIIYISNRLPEIVSKVLEKAEARAKTVDDEEIVKYITNRAEKLRRSGENLYKTEFKNGIIKEAESLFRRRGFIQSLDEGENIMGVANGVLVFDNGVQFVSGYHEYLVSMYSEVSYHPFDIKAAETKLFLKVVMGMFPDDELDMFHYLMYYFATCLDNRAKDSMFLILQGSGCHAVDTAIKMYNGTNKLVQDVVVGDQLMGDDNTPRIVKELFRGKDIMYRVSLTRGEESFVVNENHVLSIKFTNISSVCVRKDGSYVNNHKFRACWYVLNGVQAPRKVSKMFDSKQEAMDYIESKDDCIKKGDIIDIKIKDLVKWPLWWINKSNVMLYTTSTDYEEKCLPIDPYIVGFWLGDGTTSTCSFTTMDHEPLDYITSTVGDNQSVSKHGKHNNKASTYRICGKNNKNKLLDDMKGINLINNKHVPDVYKSSSRDQRLQLLAGLMDSDGYYNSKYNHYEITLKLENLVDSIVEVARSLGFSCYKYKVSKSCVYKGEIKEGVYYRTQIYGEHIADIPCKIARKVAKINNSKRKTSSMGFSLKKLDVDNYYGFELDGNHRYLTADHIVHHNSNGKSSLLELAKTVLGQYGAKVSMSILTEQRNNSSSANEQMMAYKRSRLAFYSETNKQEEINCAVVKEFTSQESVTTRAIFQSQTTFRPKCNHVITTNYYPIIKTTDYGIWRRMKLYRHKIQFKPRSKLDLNNKYEKLADENIAKEFSYNKGIREAFMSLLVEYYKDLYANHGGKLSNIRCDSLERDSLEYRNSMDTLNRFICQNVIVSKGSKVNINEMVDSYATFLVEEYGKNTQIYKNELKQLVENSELRAFYKTTSGGKTEFVGIRLHDSADSDEMLVDGEYFLKMKKSSDGEEDTSNKNYSDPLGLDEWYKDNC